MNMKFGYDADKHKLEQIKKISGQIFSRSEVKKHGSLRDPCVIQRQDSWVPQGHSSISGRLPTGGMKKIISFCRILLAREARTSYLRSAWFCIVVFHERCVVI